MRFDCCKDIWNTLVRNNAEKTPTQDKQSEQHAEHMIPDIEFRHHSSHVWVNRFRLCSAYIHIHRPRPPETHTTHTNTHSATKSTHNNGTNTTENAHYKNFQYSEPKYLEIPINKQTPPNPIHIQFRYSTLQWILISYSHESPSEIRDPEQQRLFHSTKPYKKLDSQPHTTTHKRDHTHKHTHTHVYKCICVHIYTNTHSVETNHMRVSKPGSFLSMIW